MIEISIQAQVEDAIKDLTRMEKEHVPFAISVALNRTAANAQAEVVNQMEKVFDRPTPYTLSATSIKRSTKEKLSVEVYIKDAAVKAVPAIKWLAPQIYGGARTMKRFESLLISHGVMPSGMYAMPAVSGGVRYDQYGNMSRGQIVQILSALSASRDPQQNRKPGKRGNRGRRRGGDYFVVKQTKGRLKAGIYERHGFAFGSSVRPVLIFTRAPHYARRLPFYETVERVFAIEFGRQFVLSLNAALGSPTLRTSVALAA